MYKLMIAALMLALLGLFFIERSSDRPWLRLEDFEIPTGFLHQNGQKPAAADVNQQPAIKRVYTWKDEQGVTQFSDYEKDAAGATVLELNGIINTMPAPPLPVPESTTPVDGGKPEESALTAGFNIKAAMETLEQARQLQQVVDTRKAEIDRQTESGN